MKLFGLKLPEEELNQQVEEYDILPFTKTIRGALAIIIWVVCTITLFLIVLGSLETSAFVDIAIMIFLSIFVSKGQRWAMYTLVILWTLEKIYMIAIAPSSIVSQLIFWWLIFSVSLQAISVENQRKSQMNDDNVSNKLVELSILHDKGVLNDKEFEKKKAELLKKF